jgi:hypothetical protein
MPATTRHRPSWLGTYARWIASRSSASSFRAFWWSFSACRLAVSMSAALRSRPCTYQVVLVRSATSRGRGLRQAPDTLGGMPSRQHKQGAAIAVPAFPQSGEGRLERLLPGAGAKPLPVAVDEEQVNRTDGLGGALPSAVLLPPSLVAALEPRRRGHQRSRCGTDAGLDDRSPVRRHAAPTMWSRDPGEHAPRPGHVTNREALLGAADARPADSADGPAGARRPDPSPAAAGKADRAPQ